MSNKRPADDSATDILESILNDDHILSSDENETNGKEELTASEVLKRMKIWWLNEKFSPCLLPPQCEVVNCLLEQLKELDANLNQLKFDASKDEKSAKSMRSEIRVPLHKMEMARVRFIVSSYLRIRLAKIERFIYDIPLGDDCSILSPEELAYARKFKDGLDSHFSSLALKHMPGDFGKVPIPSKSLNAAELSDQRMPQQPITSDQPSSSSGMVFVQAVKPISNLFIEDFAQKERDQEIDIELDSQHLLDFSHIYSLVKSGSVKLI